MKLIALSLTAMTIILALSVVGSGALDRHANADSAPALGDANCDTVVDSIDALLALQVDAGLLDTVGCPGTADASGDGLINSIDAALILQHAAGVLRLGALDISGRWQYDGEADYFLFDKDRSLANGGVIYTYEEICAPDGRVKGTGTATVRGSHVSMDGFDDISDYLLGLDASPGGTRLSGVRTRDEIPGLPGFEFPDVEIVLVKGTHNEWRDTACDLGIPN